MVRRLQKGLLPSEQGKADGLSEGLSKSPHGGIQGVSKGLSKGVSTAHKKQQENTN
jgi:hypothetical protein